MVSSTLRVLQLLHLVSGIWTATVVTPIVDAGELVGNDIQLNCSISFGPGEIGGITWEEIVTQGGSSGNRIYSALPDGSITWDETHPNRARYDVPAGSTNLIIKNVNLKDAGRYICKAVFATGKTEGILTILEKSKCQSNGIAIENVIGGASLTCSVKFNNSNDLAYTIKPSVAWSNDGAEAGPEGVDTVTTTANFTVSATDNGKSYTCVTSYKNPPPTYRDTCTTPIVVHYFARNVNVTSSNTDLKNTKVDDRHTCSASGNPDPTYSWQKVAGPAAAPVQVFGAVLLVTAQMEGNNVYKCIAVNRLNNGAEHQAPSNNVTFFVIIPTTTSTTLPPTNPTTSAAATTSTQPSTAANTDGGNSGPSTGGQVSTAGIVGGVLGALAGIAITAVIVVFCIIRRKKARENPPISYSDDEKAAGPPQYNPASKHPDVIRPANQNANDYNEKDDPQKRNVENLHYADLALDDTPRSRKPIQVYETTPGTEYAEIRPGQNVY